MHAEAFAWVAQHARSDRVTVLDIGGRNINGTPRGVYPRAVYTTLDILPGADIRADAATWDPPEAWDVVLCLEVFEHAERWREICATCFRACKPGGELVVTTAAPGRAVHSGVDGGPTLHPGEHYGNIEPVEFEKALVEAGFTDTLVVDHYGWDVRAYAVRP